MRTSARPRRFLPLSSVAARSTADSMTGSSSRATAKLVVGHVLQKHPAEMCLVERDQAVEAFATDRSDHTLRERVRLGLWDHKTRPYSDGILWSHSSSQASCRSCARGVVGCNISSGPRLR